MSSSRVSTRRVSGPTPCACEAACSTSLGGVFCRSVSVPSHSLAWVLSFRAVLCVTDRGLLPGVWVSYRRPNAPARRAAGLLHEDSWHDTTRSVDRLLQCVENDTDLVFTV